MFASVLMLGKYRLRGGLYDVEYKKNCMNCINLLNFIIYYYVTAWFSQTAGLQGQPTVFLFTDATCKEEAFLEDVTSILNTGEPVHLAVVGCCGTEAVFFCARAFTVHRGQMRTPLVSCCVHFLFAEISLHAMEHLYTAKANTPDPAVRRRDPQPVPSGRAGQHPEFFFFLQFGDLGGLAGGRGGVGPHGYPQEGRFPLFLVQSTDFFLDTKIPPPQKWSPETGVGGVSGPSVPIKSLTTSPRG